MNEMRLLKEAGIFYNKIIEKKGILIMKSRKKFGVFLICAALVWQIAGCGNSGEIVLPPQDRQTENNKVENEETKNEEIEKEQIAADGSRILIAYFTAGENSDVDVVSSASVTTVDGEAYDVIFVGYPTWWYDMPMALYSFFEEYDFSGKTIVPFNVHNGSRFSNTIATIQDLEPDAEVITDGFTVSERDAAEAAGDVADWLKGLGY